jgi:NAD(P)-dependent dehydrogenase (short-subunit alcohol dehydrogenase family)
MGLATAKILGRDHDVVICDLDRERLDAAVAELKHLDVTAEAVVCDITDRGSVDALVARARSAGRVTSVVHTAGVSPSMGSAEKIVKINAVGTVNVTEAFLQIASEGFALVNVASVAGHMTPKFLVPKRKYALALTDVDRFFAALSAVANRGPKKMRPGQAYSLSKNFVIWYSREQAARFGARGARILSVSPGSFDTAMGRLEEESGSGQLLQFAALKRFGQPEEVAEVLAFCASARPGYLTGTDILCDGGTVAGLTLRGTIKMALSSR